MTQISTAKNTQIVEFNPLQSRERVSVLDAAIQHAKTMRDWEALQKAVGVFRSHKRSVKLA